MLSFIKIILFFIFFNLFGGSNISHEEKLVNQLLAKSGKHLAKKYKLDCIGNGAGMPEGEIHSLYLAFQRNKPVTMDEARQLIVAMSIDFLHSINSNEELKKYCVSFPFTENNAEIALFIFSKEGRELVEPDISIASLSHGVIRYRSWDKNNSYHLITMFSETYEEALQIVEREKIREIA